jgi:hypothetical protein
MGHLTIFFLYSLWFITVSLVTVLWFVAISDIRTHIRTGLFRTADLILMATAVSVVAVSTIAVANTVVRPTFRTPFYGSWELPSRHAHRG